MIILTQPTILIKDSNDNKVNDLLRDFLLHFYEELDFFCAKNKNENFGHWFSESSFLSMYINGIIRNDGDKREFSAVQEYCVSNVISGGAGRCDGFIERNNDVFLLEAKRQQYNHLIDTDHFEIDKWLAWDKEQIQVQLKKYLLSEDKFFLDGRYQSVYLMTIVFKAIKENKSTHLEKAIKKLDVTEQISDRTWYYSTSFIGADNAGVQDGVEVYGTIEKHVTGKLRLTTV